MNEDALATVYEFEFFDKATRSWRLSVKIGTMEAIAAVGGIAVRSSALRVDRARLDEEGFLVKTRQLV